MKFTFEIPGRLPGLNEIINKARSHWSTGRKHKKQSTEYCGQWIIASGVPFFKNPVRVHFQWIEPNRRRDLDNICAGAKFCLDALVDTGRIKGDSQQWVKGITHMFGVPDKDNPRVLISIEEV